MKKLTKAEIISAVLKTETKAFAKLDTAERDYGMDSPVTKQLRAIWSGTYYACKAIGLYDI